MSSVFSALRAGECAIIQGINNSKHLADLGFIRGVTITMIKSGSPCVIKIKGQYFGLGTVHQNAIQVDLECQKRE